MSEILWEEPPASTRSGAGRPSKLFTPDVVQSLKDNPGKWVRLKGEAKRGDVSNAAAWVKRYNTNHDDGKFVSKSRTIVEGGAREVRVYARFVAPGSDEDDSE